MKLRAAGLTDVGRVRAHNEDHLAVVLDHRLFVVADGMGGQLAGEIASRMAVDSLCAQLSGLETVATAPDWIGPNLSPAAQQLVAAIRLANRSIYLAGRGNPEWNNMGTTLVAAQVIENRLLVAHVGDSRCYLLRQQELVQLTDDHSLVAEQQRLGLITKEEALTSRMKNVITRALGALDDVSVDVSERELQAGDRILLCSDGLSNMVADEALSAVIGRHDDPAQACTELVALANQSGGRDNITALLVVIDDVETRAGEAE